MKRTLTNIKSPITGGRVFLLETLEDHEYRKEKFTVHARYYVCEDTGEQFSGEGQDDLVINQVYNQWRIRHGVPFPEDIKAVRMRYGMNYSQMSKILGFGVNQWKQYEDGVIPSESNGKMIRAIENKDFMLKMLETSKAEFNNNEYKRIEIHIMAASDKVQDKDAVLFTYGRDCEPSIYNGYGGRNPEKVAEMVRWFVGKNAGICPTKLNKLMFYADFKHYRETGRSISGLRYRAIQYGPVPEHFDTIYDNIEGLEKTNEITTWGTESTAFHVTADTSTAELTDNELATLNSIMNSIGGLKARELVDLSHKETAWINNQLAHSIISYNEAFDLTGV